EPARSLFGFGIGIESKIAVSAAIVYFVNFLNTCSGVREVDPIAVNTTKIMGGGEAAMSRYASVPSAASWAIAGLKVRVPYALIDTVQGEFMSSNSGIGYS